MRPGEELMDGPPIHGNTRLEVIWTAIPAIMLVGAVLLRLRRAATTSRRPRPTQMKVRVVGEQFTWTFFYPARRRKESPPASSTCPRASQVKFTIQSKDVLHDFWVPAFRHEDRRRARASPRTIRVTPNRDRRATRSSAPSSAGSGTPSMRQSAHVVRPSEFDEWLRPAQREAAGGGGRRRRSRRRRRRGAGRQGDLHRRSRLRRLPHAGRRRHDRQRSARTSTRCSSARTRPSSSSRSPTRAP